MSHPLRIAILRARYAPGGNTPSTASCRDVLMTSPAKRGLLDYWSFNTCGYLDLTGSEMFAEVAISLELSERHRNASGNIENVFSRGTLAQKAIAATKAATGRSLDEFDGFYVHVFPGSPLVLTDATTSTPVSVNIDLGAGSVGSRQYCVLPDGVGHMLMAHELGHVLGFPDSYGILNSGVDWGGTGATGNLYGDPYDIMSAASFAQWDNPAGGVFYAGNPTFDGPVPVDWRATATSPMGPAPTQASLHKIYPNAIPTGVIRYFTLPFTTPRHARLYASQSRGGTRLIVIHPPDEPVSGTGRVYLEFRNAINWDQGLKPTGPALSRRAITAHQIAEEPGQGARVFYRGRLPVPVETDSDLRISHTTISVRVLASDLDLGFVDIELSQRGDHGGAIDKESEDIRVSPAGPLLERQTPCGDTVTYGAWNTRTVARYRGTSYGMGRNSAPFDAPVTFTWWVGDQKLTPTQAWVNVTVAGVNHRLGVAISPTTDLLELSSAPGESFSVPVHLVASDGGDSATISEIFQAPGTSSGYSAHDIGVIARCEVRMRLRIRQLLDRIDPEVLVNPFPEPPPFWHVLDRLEHELAPLVDHADASVRDLATQLRNVVDMRFR